jgi:hypothetical protein
MEEGLLDGRQVADDADDTDLDMGVPKLELDCAQKICNYDLDCVVCYRFFAFLASWIGMFATQQKQFAVVIIVLVILAGGHTWQYYKILEQRVPSLWSVYRLIMVIMSMAAIPLFHESRLVAMIVLGISAIENAVMAQLRSNSLHSEYRIAKRERDAEIDRRRADRFEREFQRQSAAALAHPHVYIASVNMV